MTYPEHSPKTPRTAHGLFVTLRAFLHLDGSGAPSSTPSSHSARLRGFPSALLTVVFGLALLVPSPASAEFVRPSLGQITGTPAGPFEFAGTEENSGGVAVDAHDHLWVGDTKNLDEFNPAYGEEPNKFLQTLTAETAAGSIAIERATTGDFYIINPHAESKVEVRSSTGTYLETWGAFSRAHVAVDNSPEGTLKDPSSCSVSGCTVYVFSDVFIKGSSHTDYGQLQKYDSKGTPVEFSDAKKCESEKCGYIEGNKVTGQPGPGCSHEFTVGYPEAAIAIDSEGDIYVAYFECDDVFEYRASGEYLRTFSIGETELPRLGEGGEDGLMDGVAIDPISGHLLVSVTTSSEANVVGAIYEFEATPGQATTGKFVHEITEASTTESATLQHPAEMVVDSIGDLYVVERGRNGAGQAVEVYGPGHYLPSLRLGKAGESKAASSVLNGSVNPEGLKLSACDFQYVTEEAFDENVKAHGGQEAEGFSDLSSGGETGCVPAPGTVPADKEYHAVHADIAGLKEGVTYRYRMVATSEGLIGGTAQSAALAFTAPAVPAIDSTAAEHLFEICRPARAARSARRRHQLSLRIRHHPVR